MPIVSSSFVVGEPQADGRRYITETHLDADGAPHVVEYLADVGLDVDAVMARRAQLIGAELDRAAAIEAAATNYRLSVSKTEFLNRFTVQERIAIRTLAQTDPIAGDFKDLLDNASVINTAHEAVQQGLAYLQSKGILTTERAAVIGA